MDSNEFLHKESCPKCGSKDNLARYSDGHGYCFGCQHREPPEGGETQTKERRSMQEEQDDDQRRAGIIPGTCQALSKRKIELTTCQAWTYQIGELNGQKVQLANHLDEHGNIIAQKVRFANKDFRVTGDKNGMALYGKWMYRGQKKDRIVVVEGEIDALSLWQLANGAFAVVSIQNGAQSAKKAIAKDLKWLEEYAQVIFLFDQDEPGQEATKECVRLLSPGKAYVAEIPLKDCNEMLLAGRGGELFKAVLNARQHKPAGLVRIKDIRKNIGKTHEITFPWFDPRITENTSGRRTGETYMVGGGTGSGKTAFQLQQVDYDLNVLKEQVAVFFLEQEPEVTTTRVASVMAKKRFYLPQDKANWTDEEFDAVLDRLENDDRLTMKNHYGAFAWEDIAADIRYLYHAEGTRIFYIDHLTALAAAEKDEREGLERIMAAMAKLVKEIPIMVMCVTHLATPEGKSHEEGGRVAIRHFKGSRAIGFWIDFAFGIERDTQAATYEDRLKMSFRILKHRLDGSRNGEVIPFTFNAETGLLIPDLSDPDAPPAPAFQPQQNTDF